MSTHSRFIKFGSFFFTSEQGTIYFAPFVFCQYIFLIFGAIQNHRNLENRKFLCKSSHFRILRLNLLFLTLCFICLRCIRSIFRTVFRRFLCCTVLCLCSQNIRWYDCQLAFIFYKFFQVSLIISTCRNDITFIKRFFDRINLAVVCCSRNCRYIFVCADLVNHFQCYIRCNICLIHRKLYYNNRFINSCRNLVCFVLRYQQITDNILFIEFRIILFRCRTFFSLCTGSFI